MPAKKSVKKPVKGKSNKGPKVAIGGNGRKKERSKRSKSGYV